MIKGFVIVFNLIYVIGVLGDSGSDYNEVNTDGSFAFGFSNDDIGSYYHTAAGSANKIIRGRYGSRNPDTKRIEETVYTAGPRGFRARGPSIHRQMDLSQYPRGPIGTPDDPLADPYDDPSYDFSFRNSDQERKEEADSTGRVRGLYSYLDDIGELHTVRYAAGAETGFEVINSVPDAIANVAYNTPLYKAPSKTRGRMSTQRGPDGQYKFILSGPDQRRSETSGPDGVVRGSYSYLDDKGVQRTVQYIAGPGIGYRIVKNLVGPGTHVKPEAGLYPSYGIRDFDSNNLDDDGFLKTAESGPILPKGGMIGEKDIRITGPGRRPSLENDFKGRPLGKGNLRPVIDGGGRRGGTGGRYRPSISDDGRNFKDFTSTADDLIPNHEKDKDLTYGSRKDIPFSETKDNKTRGKIIPNRADDVFDTGYEYGRGIPGRRIRPGSSNDFYGQKTGNKSRDFGGGRNQGRYYPDERKLRPDSRVGPSIPSRDRISGGRRGDGSSSNRNNIFDNDDYGSDDFPLTTRRLEIDHEKDWSSRGKDPTIIKNVGKWYVGLPPGSAVRAHVQSIDLLPLSGRAVAPSEALLRDQLKQT